MLFYKGEGGVEVIYDRFDQEILYHRECGKNWEEILEEKLSELRGGIPETDDLIKRILLLEKLEGSGKASKVFPAGSNTLGGWNL